MVHMYCGLLQTCLQFHDVFIVLYWNLHSGSQLKSNQTQTKIDFISIFQKEILHIIKKKIIW